MQKAEPCELTVNVPFIVKVSSTVPESFFAVNVFLPDFHMLFQARHYRNGSFVLINRNGHSITVIHCFLAYKPLIFFRLPPLLQIGIKAHIIAKRIAAIDLLIAFVHLSFPPYQVRIPYRVMFPVPFNHMSQCSDCHKDNNN